MKEEIECLITKDNERFFFELNEKKLHFYDCEYTLTSEIVKNESSQDDNDEQQNDGIDADESKNKANYFFFFDY